MAKPTRPEMKRLVALYARKILAQEQGVAIKIQERCHQGFERKLNQLRSKYPEILGTLTDVFCNRLERAARRHNANRMITGLGIDF